MRAVWRSTCNDDKENNNNNNDNDDDDDDDDDKSVLLSSFAAGSFSYTNITTTTTTTHATTTMIRSIAAFLVVASFMHMTVGFSPVSLHGSVQSSVGTPSNTVASSTTALKMADGGWNPMEEIKNLFNGNNNNGKNGGNQGQDKDNNVVMDSLQEGTDMLSAFDDVIDDFFNKRMGNGEIFYGKRKYKPSGSVDGDYNGFGLSDKLKIDVTRQAKEEYLDEKRRREEEKNRK